MCSVFPSVTNEWSFQDQLPSKIHLYLLKELCVPVDLNNVHTIFSPLSNEQPGILRHPSSYDSTDSQSSVLADPIFNCVESLLPPVSQPSAQPFQDNLPSITLSNQRILSQPKYYPSNLEDLCPSIPDQEQC